MSASASNKFSIENEYLRIRVSDLGAELQSLYDKVSGTELLWQAGAAWPKHAPVLFPIVGALKENQIQYNGQVVTLNRHGFARDKRFTLKESGNDFLLFELKDDVETLQVYPFQFQFLINYSLTGDKLTVEMKVINTGDKELLCSYGGHPAFRVPLDDTEVFEDYDLVFEPAEHRIRRFPLDNNLISSMPVGIATPEGKLPVSRDLFAGDAIVMKDFDSRSVSLVSRKSGKGLRMEAAGWPYFGIWSAKGGDFICLEPWQGIADTTDSDGRLETKEGLLHLEPGSTHSSSFTVAFTTN